MVQAKQLKLIILFMLPLTTWAQLVEFPVERKPNTGSTSSSARIKTTPVSLPFWDDFSFTADHYPADSLWVNNQKVLVNSGQGINPPTINVATFDGLNENGQPYNPTDGLDYGYRDTLESQPILMTEVDLAFRNTVFLSFYYQWGGNGEPPDQNDFLRLEFKNEDEEWEEAMIMRSNTDQNPAQFNSALIRINDTRFYHDDFRFRFISFGRRSGRYDAWHIDYVYMNKERDANDDSYPDRAYNTLLSPLFHEYHSVPQRHFNTDPAGNIGFSTFGLSNLENSAQPMNYTLDATISAYEDGIPNEQNVNLAAISPILPSIGAKETRIITLTQTPDLSAYTLADSVFVNLQLTLETGDSINTGFEPVNFQINDTLRQSFSLKDYYAYDDGTAEYGGGPANVGNILAYRFEMQTILQDTINGISIHFPYFSGIVANSIDFFIFSDAGGTPGNLIYEQSVEVVQKGNNEFHFTKLFEGVLVQDAFFIGYRKNPPDEALAWVGIDKSNDTGDQLFYKSNESSSTWIQNNVITGSLMMRPHFGKADVVTSTQEELQQVSLYPNPTQGTFYVKGIVDHIEVMTLTGQPVHFQTENFVEEKRIEVAAPAGVYLVRYKSGARIFTRKIIITR